MVSYADVYNLEDPMHAEPRRYTDDDGQFRWRYYEGYGRADCPEKRVFLTSVNDVHPLWSSETPERLSKKSYPLSQIGIGVHFAESLRETHIDETTGIDLLGQSRSLVDFSDRENRISWNFAKMLKIFADNTERENSSAFYENRGLKWAQKNDMMAKQISPSYRIVHFNIHHPDWGKAADSRSADSASRILAAMDKEFAPL